MCVAELAAVCCDVVWCGLVWCGFSNCVPPTALPIIVAPLQNGWTPLYRAAQNGHVEVVHALIAAGAFVNEAENVRCSGAAMVWCG